MDLEEDDLDDLMASTAQIGKPRRVDPKHLSKIWRNSLEDAKKIIDVTTHCTYEEKTRSPPCHQAVCQRSWCPDPFVADMTGEQMSSEVKNFCNDIGATLRALEE